MSSPTRGFLYSVAFISLASVVIAGGVGCDELGEPTDTGADTSGDPGESKAQGESEAPRGEFLSEPLTTPPNGPNDGANDGASPAASTLAPGTDQDSAQSNRRPAATRSTPASAPLVHLSIGVALAQTLPSGTGMSFSVDYKFRAGQPNPASQYFWVIEGGGGKSLQQPQPLKTKGNLVIIVPGLRPESGPFSSHILEITTDGKQRKISRSIDMR